VRRAANLFEDEAAGAYPAGSKDGLVVGERGQHETFVYGLWARILRVASIPLPSASLTSITITSSFVLSA